MKATVFHEFGDAEKLRYEEMPIPTIQSNEALIKVKACALNHLDLWVREGKRGSNIAMPHIAGSDIAGEIVDVGSLVRDLSVGDSVFVSPGLSCGKCAACLSGKDNICSDYSIIGAKENGGYAEYVKVPFTNLIGIPKGLDFNEAAAIPLVFLTAWHALVTTAQITPQNHVLVMAASSGLGSAAVQVAKLFGAKVFATAGTNQKCKKVLELGADVAINHAESNVLAEVLRATSNRGVDVVFDHVGSSTWEGSVKSLVSGGKLVTCGVTTGSTAQLDIRYLISKNIQINAALMGSKGELFKLLQFVEAGRLRPVVDRTYPLSKAGEAHRLMESRIHFGKIILNP